MLFLILLAPILFNATGLIDTFLTTKFKNHESDGLLADGIATLMVIGGVVALFVSLMIFLFYGNNIFLLNGNNILLLLIGGMLYGFAAYPYFKALHMERIENIIPVLQTIPLFTYLGAYFILGEALGFTQVLIIVAIVITTMLFGRDYHNKTMNRPGILFTIGSSILYSISYVFFKLAGADSLNIWVLFFWEHLGVAIACSLYLLKANVCSSTRTYFKANGWRFSFLNLANEFFYIIGVMIMNVLSLLYPVAVVSVLGNGVQPILGFVMVFVAYKAYPKLFEWSYSKEDLGLKIGLCVIACGLLAWFFHLTS